MEPLLWTFEEIAAFVTHPDKPVRRWAQDRLLGLFPERAPEVLTAQLGDEDFYTAMRAAEAIGKTGDAARYGPIVLEHMQRAPALHFAAWPRLPHSFNLPKPCR
jgi:HEAT repeat protein